MAIHKARLAQLAGDDGEEAVGHRHVEQHIATQRLLLVQVGQKILQLG